MINFDDTATRMIKELNRTFDLERGVTGKAHIKEVLQAMYNEGLRGRTGLNRSTTLPLCMRCGQPNDNEGDGDGCKDCVIKLYDHLFKRRSKYLNLVRKDALEEAAQIAEECSEPWQGGEVSQAEQGMGRLIARAIRAKGRKGI